MKAILVLAMALIANSAFAGEGYDYPAKGVLATSPGLGIEVSVLMEGPNGTNIQRKNSDGTYQPAEIVPSDLVTIIVKP
jgi:hypothetical protein